MAAVSALSAVTPALAVEQHSGDGNKVPVELTVEKPTFSVTVPTGLPVAVDAAGKVYCSTTATIKNNTFGQVKVSNVTIDGNQPWTVADWALDMQKEKVNTTKIAMQLNKGVTGPAGYQFAPENFPVMDGHASLPLTYDAKLPAQTKVISGDTVANVVFTVGWNTSEATGYDVTPSKDLADIIDENGIAQVKVGDSIRLEAAATYSEGQTFWESDQPSIVQITEDAEDHCIAKVVGPGSTTVTYTKNGVKGEIQFTSKAPLLNISLDKTSLKFEFIGDTEQLNVNYNPSNTTDPKTVQWSVAPAGVVTVENGKVKATGWGNATITAKVGQKSVNCSVSVDDGELHPSGSPLDKAMMATQLSDLTGTITFSRERAPVGETVPLNADGSVVAKISGQDATVYSKNGVGVAAPVDCSWLFNKGNKPYYDGYKAKTLNLDGLDISKVESMRGMFAYSAATTINGLNGFKTRNVWNTMSMFAGSQAPTLDLSSFNFTRVSASNMEGMFAGSKATTIYCRTQTDKDKMATSKFCTPRPEYFIVGKHA